MRREVNDDDDDDRPEPRLRRRATATADDAAPDPPVGGPSLGYGMRVALCCVGWLLLAAAAGCATFGVTRPAFGGTNHLILACFLGIAARVVQAQSESQL